MCRNSPAWRADGFDHARMGMPGGNDGDARIEIEEAIAIHVFDHGAFAAFDDQRITARIGRRNDCAIAFNDRFRLRTGKFGY